MSRPSTITDEQILSPARELFLEKGIRATTSEVAKRAGIAEGSIFKRFKTKGDLFRAAMRPQLEEARWLATLATSTGKGDVRDTLYRAGLEAMEFFRTLMPLMMMSWSNPDDSDGSCVNPNFGPNPPALRALKTVSGFFEAEMRAGRLRRHDPEILARVFVGSIQNYVFFEMVLKAHDELPLPEESFLRGLIQLLWKGADPRRPRAPQRR